MFIDVDDLAAYLRDAGAPGDVLFQLADLANGVVSDTTGALDPVPTRVKAITLEVAARAYRNPQGFSSESVDDYTYRRDSATRQAGVYLTAAESSELLTLAGKRRQTAYSISMSHPWDEA